MLLHFKYLSPHRSVFWADFRIRSQAGRIRINRHINSILIYQYYRNIWLLTLFRFCLTLSWILMGGGDPGSTPLNSLKNLDVEYSIWTHSIIKMKKALKFDLFQKCQNQNLFSRVGFWSGFSWRSDPDPFFFLLGWIQDFGQLQPDPDKSFQDLFIDI